MKIIVKIARAELRTLFYSPVAWVTIVVFFVISGMQFVTPLKMSAIEQDLKIINSPSWEGFPGPLTFKMFIGTLLSYLGYIYLFIPLLTMGTINREETSGTMKLLSSSPVRIREIVLGKFTGLMAFNLVLLSSIALLLFTGYFSIQHAELKWYLSMLLGIFFLTSVYMAIGLFISCLTNYQIVAGIITFIAFFILGSMNKVLQQYDFVRDLTWFLSLKGRIEPFLHGLITTRELFYFTLMINLFLGLAMIKLKSRQESKKWTVSFSRNLALICTILVLGYFSSRPGYIGYLDVTRDQRQTLDSATQAVLKELDGSPLTVTLYGNLMGENMLLAMPAQRNEYIWQFWEQYKRFYPNINFKYLNYYGIKEKDTALLEMVPGKNLHQIAEQMAKLFQTKLSKFLKPEEIQKQVDLSGEDELKLVMQVEYNGKKTFLRTFGYPAWPPQPVMSASIRRLTQPGVPQVLFTTGHYERSPWRNGEREFGTHTNMQRDKFSLINQGMDSDTINLMEKDIPEGTDILVVADPRSVLHPEETAKIKAFIDQGGNVIFYGEPGKQEMLNPVLNSIGINLDKGELVAPQPHSLSNVFRVFLTPKANHMAREEAMQVGQSTGGLGAYTDVLGACNISYHDTDGFKAEPILPLKGKKNTWIEYAMFKEDSAKPTFNPAEGDLQLDEYILGVRLTRKINNREQRIVVVSDADFMSAGLGEGLTIGVGFYSWLAYNKYPVYTKLIAPKDIRLSIGPASANTIWYTYVYILPAILLLTGTIILIRRKRK